MSHGLRLSFKLNKNKSMEVKSNLKWWQIEVTMMADLVLKPYQLCHSVDGPTTPHSACILKLGTGNSIEYKFGRSLLCECRLLLLFHSIPIFSAQKHVVYVHDEELILSDCALSLLASASYCTAAHITVIRLNSKLKLKPPCNCAWASSCSEKARPVRKFVVR